LAVYFFFVISGFLITRSFETTRSLPRYLQKRVARIVPGFLVASFAGIFIGALSVHDLSAYFSRIDYRFLARVLTLHPADAPGAFPDNPMRDIVGGTLWSIRFEFNCYLLVAALACSAGFGVGPSPLLSSRSLVSIWRDGLAA
jgi:peptidoglycan/LPS O-acetylase OafA/YrhL